jgi:hypothetical protein
MVEKWKIAHRISRIADKNIKWLSTIEKYPTKPR